MQLSWKEGILQILTAIDAINDDRNYMRWVAGGLGYETKITFEEFKKKIGVKSAVYLYMNPPKIETPDKTLNRVAQIISMTVK